MKLILTNILLFFCLAGFTQNKGVTGTFLQAGNLSEVVVTGYQTQNHI